MRIYFKIPQDIVLTLILALAIFSVCLTVKQCVIEKARIEAIHQLDPKALAQKPRRK